MSVSTSTHPAPRSLIPSLVPATSRPAIKKAQTSSNDQATSTTAPPGLPSAATSAGTAGACRPWPPPPAYGRHHPLPRPAPPLSLFLSQSCTGGSEPSSSPPPWLPPATSSAAPQKAGGRTQDPQSRSAPRQSGARRQPPPFGSTSCLPATAWARLVCRRTGHGMRPRRSSDGRLQGAAWDQWIPLSPADEARLGDPINPRDAACNSHAWPRSLSWNLVGPEAELHRH
jgi:hypothetical protein